MAKKQHDYKIRRYNTIEYYGKFKGHGLTLSDIHCAKAYCWETTLGWTASVSASTPLIVRAVQGLLLNDPVVLGVCAGIALLGLIVALSGMIPLYKDHNVNQTQLAWKIFGYTPKKDEIIQPSV